MKKYAVLIMVAVFLLTAETLFQVKDSQDRVVLDVSTDGLRVYNEGDLLMEISSSDIRAFIDNDPSKGLARSFSVTTSSNQKGDTNVLEVTTDATQMREGDEGQQYTDFSPENIFLGLNAGKNTDYDPQLPGRDYVIIGNEAGANIRGGVRNVYIGHETGYGYGFGNPEPSPGGEDNIFIGYRAGYKNWNSVRQMFIGTEAGTNQTGGSHNTYIGTSAGMRGVNGSHNLFLGANAGWRNISGSNNTFIGTGSGSGSQDYSVNYNTFIGQGSGVSIITGGSNNSFFGASAGSRNTSGANNILFGRRAGYNNLIGSNNTIIGTEAGYGAFNASFSGNVFLGYQAGYNETGSNRLYIANSNTSTPLIKGTFPNTDLTFTANRVNVVHPIGSTTNGLTINNTYNGNTTTWRFYQMISNDLGLYHNANYRGQWDEQSGAYSSTSDIRLKKNIENLFSVTEKVMKLQPQIYNYNDQKEDERRYIGLIAQDVENIFPEFVYYSQEDDTYTIDYSGLSVVAIQAIKEQQSKIEYQQNKIDELEKQNDMIIRELSLIKRTLNLE